MKRGTKRYFYLGFGWLMFALGFIGAFLPVLPTVPLMILALWGFSNGSESLHDWLYNHPKYGQSLRDWDKYRMIPIKAKIMSISMMSISALYMIFFSNVPTIALYCALGFMAYGAFYVLTKTSRIIEPEEKPFEEKITGDKNTDDRDISEKITDETTPPQEP